MKNNKIVRFLSMGRGSSDTLTPAFILVPRNLPKSEFTVFLSEFVWFRWQFFVFYRVNYFIIKRYYFIILLVVHSYLRATIQISLVWNSCLLLNSSVGNAVQLPLSIAAFININRQRNSLKSFTRAPQSAADLCSRVATFIIHVSRPTGNQHTISLVFRQP